MLPCLWGSGNPGVVTASSHRPAVQYVCRGLIWYLPRKLNNLKILKNAIIPAGTAPPIVHRNTFITAPNSFRPVDAASSVTAFTGFFFATNSQGKKKKRKKVTKKEKKKKRTVQYSTATVLLHVLVLVLLLTYFT